MDWLKHPRYAHERLRVINVLRHDEYDFRGIKKVVFLCGGFESPRRNDLRAYLERFVPDALVFYAESVWAVIAATAGSNALAMEQRLASLADICIVIVESPGTFAELGAFALSDDLRRKLLPILDSRHRGAESFLATGPVRWVDADSLFAPTIWTDLDQLLLAADQIQERLKRLKRTSPTRIKDLASSPKHLLFFVCDLVSVFGPCPREHVELTVAELLGSIASASVDTGLLLGLGKAMNLLGSFVFDGREMFFRKLSEGRLISFQRKRHIDLTTLRSDVLSAMQACRICDAVLVEFAKHT